MKLPTLVLGALLLSAAVAVAQAPDAIGEVKALYESAAYEDALTKLASMADQTSGKVDQYRAFCLLALGRQAEASAAVDKAVHADPAWVPAPGDASPRVRTFYSDERRRLLPEIVRGIYADAKAAYAKKEYPAAATGFKRVVALIDGTGPDADDSLSDLKLVAQGFADLSSKTAGASPAPPQPALPTPGSSGSAPKSSGVTRGPITISEALPAWRKTTRFGNREGLLRIEIDESGAVTGATVVKTTDPYYDSQLLEAARHWTYQPALVGGRPTNTTKEIFYSLKDPSR